MDEGVVDLEGVGFREFLFGDILDFLGVGVDF